MTPMVDLGFLLISFFIFTTNISQPTSLGLIMPKEGGNTEIKESQTLTVLPAEGDRLFAYEGQWQTAYENNRILSSNYHAAKGIGQLIRNKQKKLGANRIKLFLIIKPTASSSYKNLVDLLDETMINDVRYYAVVEPTEEEKKYLKDRLQTR